MIRAFLVTLLAILLLVVVALPLIVYSLLTRNAATLYQVGIQAVRIVLRAAGVRLEVQGCENIPPRRAVVYMPNHQGNCDPPAVISILPQVRAIAKKEFFRVPILGTAMRLCGFIPVDRKNRERAIEAIEEGVKALKAGHSFMVFPEGTRSPDGRLQPFKKGVFVMALEAGAPIVPMSVSGSSKIMRKGEFVIYPGQVRITIHPSVPTEGCTLDDRDEIMDHVRRAILSGLAEDELPLDAIPSRSSS
ncbi:MAG: 1-acyl-sn-glycerol-3-phosphate acyltransferase [Acidobacteria bacterium]|nr:1-acyl-sn-glycerol-3-phosphate acyltransferase [Acidobacteriota bacterium]